MTDNPARKRLNKSQRQAVYAKCAGHCAYCGTAISIGEMQADHKTPIRLSESIDQSVNQTNNLLPACRSCNQYKSSLTIEKFRAAVESFPEVLMRDSATYRIAVRFGMVESRPHKVVFWFERAWRDASGAQNDG